MLELNIYTTIKIIKFRCVITESTPVCIFSQIFNVLITPLLISVIILQTETNMIKKINNVLCLQNFQLMFVSIKSISVLGICRYI